MVFCVSSVLSTPNFGMTFSQTDTSKPSSAFRHCCWGRAVARENDWELRADRGEHLRVMNDAGAVAAVRAADQKKNVRVHALNGFQIVLRQLE